MRGIIIWTHESQFRELNWKLLSSLPTRANEWAEINGAQLLRTANWKYVGHFGQKGNNTLVVANSAELIWSHANNIQSGFRENHSHFGRGRRILITFRWKAQMSFSKYSLLFKTILLTISNWNALETIEECIWFKLKLYPHFQMRYSQKMVEFSLIFHGNETWPSFTVINLRIRSLYALLLKYIIYFSSFISL